MQNLNTIAMQLFREIASCSQGYVLNKGVALIITVSICLMFVNGVAMAREVHSAHTHGVASLTLAFERGVLEVEFESPAMGILGFEHQPDTEQQIEIIETSRALLKSPEKILSIVGASCSAESVTVDVHGPAGQDLYKDEKHHHSHQGSAENHLAQSENHSEILATYMFRCVGDETLRSVSVSLFEHFSGLEKIKVNWVTEAEQGEVVLRPKSSVIELR